MTKEEIYKYIKYNGVYDNGVKKRLKKLIKKYHPDLNNGDDTVMKVINEVKKEIESNIVSINNSETTIKKSNNSNIDVINITSLISKLNSEIDSLNKMIEKGNHDEYKLFLEYNSSLSLYNTLKLNERLIKDKIVRLKRVRSIDKFNIFLIIISLILMIYSLYFSIMLVSIIYLEIILVLIRYFKIKKYKEELREISIMDQEYKEFSDGIKNEIDILNKDLFGIKKDVRINKEKVRYYENMINDSDSDIYDKNKVR